MAPQKSRLDTSLRASCDELRGGMDVNKDCNLDLSRCLDTTGAEELQELDAWWQAIPGLEEALFVSGSQELKVAAADIKTTIHNHPQFQKFTRRLGDLFTEWQQEQRPHLTGFDRGDIPARLIATLAEALLARFTSVPPLNGAHLYQYLMDYWEQTMRDDCRLIAADGWKAEVQPICTVVESGDKEAEKKETGWKCELVPKQLLVTLFFAAEQEKIEALQNELESCRSEQAGLMEEFGGEGGALEGVRSKADGEQARSETFAELLQNDEPETAALVQEFTEEARRQKAEMAQLAARPQMEFFVQGRKKLMVSGVKAALADADAATGKLGKKYLRLEKESRLNIGQAASVLMRMNAHYKVLAAAGEEKVELLAPWRATLRWLELLEQQKEGRARLKKLEKQLDALARERCLDLSMDEIKTLVVEEKWLASLQHGMQAEVERISEGLISRITELAASCGDTTAEL